MASELDIVVNASTGFHARSTESLVRGPVLRLQDQLNPKPWIIIYLSSQSDVMCAPLDSDPFPEKRLSPHDADPDAIYNQEKAIEAIILILAEDGTAGGVGCGPGDWACTRSWSRRRTSSEGARRAQGPRPGVPRLSCSSCWTKATHSS